MRVIFLTPILIIHYKTKHKFFLNNKSILQHIFLYIYLWPVRRPLFDYARSRLPKSAYCSATGRALVRQREVRKICKLNLNGPEAETRAAVERETNWQTERYQSQGAGATCASIIMRNANELEIIFNSLVSHLLSWSVQLIRFAIFKYLCALCFHYLFDSRNLCLHPEIEIRNWNRIGRTFFGQLQPLGKLRVPYQAIDKAVNVF